MSQRIAELRSFDLTTHLVGREQRFGLGFVRPQGEQDHDVVARPVSTDLGARGAGRAHECHELLEHAHLELHRYRAEHDRLVEVEEHDRERAVTATDAVLDAPDQTVLQPGIDEDPAQVVEIRCLRQAQTSD